MIIGITGTIRSGKDTVATYLTSHHGFVHYSLSAYIRSVARARGADQKDRTVLQDIANELRVHHGSGILAEKALEYFKPGMKYVVSSIRNPTEIEVLKREKNFVLLSIDAPVNDRYKRSVASGDQKFQTFEEFVASEEREKSNNPHEQQLHSCMAMADYKIVNVGIGPESVKALEQKIDEVLQDITLKRATKK